nr:TPA_asm: M37.5 uORF 1 [Murid betaherpesvirus 1]DBA07964.1 TPA_asm: M37.5 uORF 1 [Murid betaherpesvirus 1]
MPSRWSVPGSARLTGAGRFGISSWLTSASLTTSPVTSSGP